jgi:hypothetical protein
MNRPSVSQKELEKTQMTGADNRFGDPRLGLTAEVLQSMQKGPAEAGPFLML